MTSAPAKPSVAEYASPDELFRFLERNPVGPDYVRRTAEMIRTKYPASWQAMRPRLKQLYRAEVSRLKLQEK
jgi:hypothetical protein